MSSRYSLVSSLYGPGTVGCWLFTLGSAIISWTFNPVHRKKDSIDNDFMAALSLPLIAACHLVLQIRHFPGDKSTIITTADDTLLQYTAAIEAPLNICETFEAVALPLFFICAFRHNFKRAVSTAIVGLVCFAAEAFLSFQSSTVDPGSSNLSRPYLLNLTGAILIIIATLGYIAIFYLICLGILAFTSVSTTPQFDSEYDGRPMLRVRMSPENLFWIANVSILPIGFLSGGVTMLSSFGLFGYTTLSTIGWNMTQFIPASDISITELDQAVALAGGFTTFLYSAYDAFKSTLKDHAEREENHERERRIEALEFELGEYRRRADGGMELA